MARQLITQKEYAGRRKLSKQRINQLVKSGVITLIKGKIDPDKADKQILDHSVKVEGRERGTQDSPKGSYADLKKKELQFKIALKKIEYDQQVKNVIKVDELRPAFIKWVVDIKTRLLGLKNKCAQEVVYLVIKMVSEAKSVTEIITEVSKIIGAEHEEALRELSKAKF